MHRNIKGLKNLTNEELNVVFDQAFGHNMKPSETDAPVIGGGSSDDLGFTHKANQESEENFESELANNGYDDWLDTFFDGKIFEEILEEFNRTYGGEKR